MTATASLAQRLVDALLARGAREIFGIPGDFALPLFREIERDGRLPILTLAHEPSVGFAADASARVRGALGVAAVTYGAGALNLVNAVASAYAERVPLVVLSGAPAAHEAVSGLLLHHQVKQIDSQWRLYEEITVDRARLAGPHPLRQQQPADVVVGHALADDLLGDQAVAAQEEKADRLPDPAADLVDHVHEGPPLEALAVDVQDAVPGQHPGALGGRPGQRVGHVGGAGRVVRDAGGGAARGAPAQAGGGGAPAERGGGDPDQPAAPRSADGRLVGVSGGQAGAGRDPGGCAGARAVGGAGVRPVLAGPAEPVGGRG